MRLPGQMGDEAGVDAALLAHSKADGHRKGAIARLRTVGPETMLLMAIGLRSLTVLGARAHLCQRARARRGGVAPLCRA